MSIKDATFKSSQSCFTFFFFFYQYNAPWCPYRGYAEESLYSHESGKDVNESLISVTEQKCCFYASVSVLGVWAGHHLQLWEGLFHPGRIPDGRRDSRNVQSGGENIHGGFRHPPRGTWRHSADLVMGLSCFSPAVFSALPSQTMEEYMSKPSYWAGTRVVHISRFGSESLLLIT